MGVWRYEVEVGHSRNGWLPSAPIYMLKVIGDITSMTAGRRFLLPHRVNIGFGKSLGG